MMMVMEFLMKVMLCLCEGLILKFYNKNLEDLDDEHDGFPDPEESEYNYEGEVLLGYFNLKLTI